MKTEMLHALLDEKQWKGSFMRPGECVAAASVVALEECRAELEAIETALAVKDEAIRTGLSYAIGGCEEHYGESRTKKGQHQGWPEENLREIERMEAALGEKMKTEDIQDRVREMRAILTAGAINTVRIEQEMTEIIESLLKAPGYCEWRQEDPFGGNDSCIWQTDCGHEFVFDEGTPSENDAKFCLYCGKKLVERVVKEVK